MCLLIEEDFLGSIILVWYAMQLVFALCGLFRERGNVRILTVLNILYSSLDLYFSIFVCVDAFFQWCTCLFFFRFLDLLNFVCNL
jgi:hypothetical protein